MTHHTLRSQLPPVEAKPDQPAAKPAGPWKEAKVLEHAGWLAGSVAYSSDGKTMFVGGTDGHARAYDTANWKQLWSTRAMPLHRRRLRAG